MWIGVLYLILSCYEFLQTDHYFISIRSTKKNFYLKMNELENSNHLN